MLTAHFGSVDDLLFGVYSDLLDGSGLYEVNSSKGQSVERLGALMELQNPLARLSRSVGRGRVFSALGELIWYLPGSNSIEQINFYIGGYWKFSDDGTTANGAYGPRIFRLQSEGDQSRIIGSAWNVAVSRLRGGAGSRNAVIPIARHEDFSVPSKDRPCTCVLQFLVRDGRLNLYTHMRSNDAFLGMPHDIFSFTMLQEIAARELQVELGSYYHSVSSLHLYQDDPEPNGLKPTSLARQYLEEGFHSPRTMPKMPPEDPWPSVAEVVRAEVAFREGQLDYRLPSDLPVYWKDLATLLRAHSIARKLAGAERLSALNACLVDLGDDYYRLFVLDKIQSLEAAAK